MKPKIESDVCRSVVMDVFWQIWGRTKTTPDKTFQTRNPGQNLTVKNLRELRKNPLYVCTCMYALHVLLKIGGGPRCVSRPTLGGSRDVWQSDRGRESKLVQNSATYFMNGPYVCLCIIYIRLDSLERQLLPAEGLSHTDLFSSLIALTRILFLQ